MKLCFISDTHNQLEHMTDIIPKGIDYLIHCGDITNYGNIAELSRANKVFGEIKQEIGCEIICIAGNHDLGLEGSIYFNRQILNNCVYVEDNSYKLMNGMWLYGSPITPRFYNWAFMKEGSSINEYWEQIPDDIDILITHGPPKSILDKNGLDEECGCPYLRDRVLKLPNLKIHAYGHIHQAAGQTEFNNIKFINASSINPNGYRYYNKPILIDI